MNNNKAKNNATEPNVAVPHDVDENATVEIIGVRFKSNGKPYFFDPKGKSFEVKQHVIVETARGLEIGEVCQKNTNVPAKKIVLPLREVVRLANDEDLRRSEENRKKEREAMEICRKKIEAHKLDMNLVDVNYTFDNSKLLFYFTADGRVDFRELVKDLASVFRTRIELRQIGIRDEAKMVGGYGICGRPFCCASYLQDFVQVSIKMAKEQNFSLNSAKISGSCGRLMCCLRYEHETYEEEIKKTPPVGSVVKTANGNGTVIETNPLAGLVRVRLDEKQEAPKLYNREDVTVLSRGKGKVRHESSGDIDDASEELSDIPEN